MRVVAFFVFLMVSLSQSVTYYVSPSGNDFNSGLAGSPWRTLRRACIADPDTGDTINYVRPGDTVIVLPGIYMESLTPKASGTPESCIVYKADSGAVEIFGRFPLDSVIPAGATWDSVDSRWPANTWRIPLSKAEFQGGEALVSSSPADSPCCIPAPFCEWRYIIFCRDTYPDSIPTSTFPESASVVPAFASGTLYVRLPSGKKPNDYYKWWIRLPRGIYINRRSNIVIDGFVVHDFAKTGVAIYHSDRIIVRNCEVYHNGRTGIADNWSSNVLIQSCEVYDNCGCGGFSSGISVYKPTGANHIICGCVSHHNKDSGYWTTYPTDGKGFILDCAAESDTNGGALFINNVAYANGSDGLSIYKSHNATIINNTFCLNGTDPTFVNCGEIAIRWKDTLPIIPKNLVVKNNILISRPATSRCPVFFSQPIGASEVESLNWRWDWNMYLHGDTARTDIFKLDTLLRTLAQQISTTGLDSHSRVALPSFVDPSIATFDWHLVNHDNPAINAGEPNYRLLPCPPYPDCVRHDIDGEPRIQNDTVDVGADEVSLLTRVSNTLISSGNAVIISPNPANSYCTIIVPIAAEVTIYDVLGRKVAFLSKDYGKVAYAQKRVIIWKPDKLTSSGVFIMRAKLANGFLVTKKIFLVK